jgi:EmrB/QacA subfamily drug resistance transporter
VTALDAARSPASTAVRSGTILTFLSLGQFVVFLNVTGINLALPAIQAALGMSDVSLNYIVTAYATVLGGFLLLGGRLADTFGRRKLLQTGFVVFALASFLAAIAPNGTLLITARGLQGLGAALIAPAALAILTTTFPEGPPRNTALGVWGSLAGVASTIGVIAGGILTDGPGWTWNFWINVPVGLLAAILAPRVVPESRLAERPRSFDTAGAVTLTAGLLLLIFTLGEATHAGWTSVRTIASLAGVVVLLGGFVLIEARTAEPMMPLRIFRSATMRVANLSAVLIFGTFAALFFFASLFMQHVYGYSAMTAGFAYLPLALCIVAGAGIASWLVTKLAARPVLIAGIALTIAGLLLLWRAPIGGSYLVDLLPALLALGLGCGTCYVTLQIAAFTGISDTEAGVGAGVINTSQEAGSALGVAVIATIAYTGMTTVLSAAGNDPDLIRAANAAAHHTAFLTAAALATVALLLAAFLMPRRPSHTP